MMRQDYRFRTGTSLVVCVLTFLIISLFINSSHSNDTTPYKVVMQQAQNTDFENEFMKIAFDLVESKNTKLAKDGEISLRQFVRVGVIRLNKERASEEKIEIARKNLVIFINALIQNAETIDGNKIILEKTISSVKTNLCPLYPFC